MNSKALLEYTQQYVAFSDREKEAFLSSFESKKLRKKQFLVQPDFINKQRSFVIKGAFRSYIVTESGEEKTLQFAIENWWVSDFNSYLYQQPARLFIVALEDSEILQIPFEKEQKLKEEFHKIERFFRIMAEKGLAFEHRRILTDLTLNAEERYLNFLNHYPNFIQRVPQYALASYLGMTPEFLSRIRKKNLSRTS